MDNGGDIRQVYNQRQRVFSCYHSAVGQRRTDLGNQAVNHAIIRRPTNIGKAGNHDFSLLQLLCILYGAYHTDFAHSGTTTYRNTLEYIAFGNRFHRNCLWATDGYFRINKLLLLYHNTTASQRLFIERQILLSNQLADFFMGQEEDAILIY